jgi:hypothetical protein
MSRLVAILVVLAVGVTAVGCGGDTKSKNDYVDAVNEAQNAFVSSVQKLNTGTGSDSFEQLDVAMTKVISDLKAVEPPSEVESLHNELVKALGDFKNAVAAVGDAVASKDLKKIAAAQEKFASESTAASAKIQSTITEINKKLQE